MEPIPAALSAGPFTLAFTPKGNLNDPFPLPVLYTGVYKLKVLIYTHNYFSVAK